MKLLGLICLWMTLTTCQGYRILAVFPFSGKSHFIMFEHLMKGLARKGHQVDVVSTFPLKKPYPNYRDIIVLPTHREFMNNMTFNDMNSMVLSASSAVATFGGTEVCEHLADSRIQNLVKNPPKDPPYDVVLIEVFGANCFAAIAYLLKLPLVGVSSSILYPWQHDLIGNPENLAFAPNNILPFPQRMSFWQRTYNLVHTVYHKLNFNYQTSTQTEVIRKYLSEDLPDIRTLEKYISLILSNSYISLNGIKDMTPGLIEVGGLHVQEEGVELPASLEKWMNESTNGFVYFTFGSMVKIETFPLKFQEIFFKSLGKIAPVRVLMKIVNPNELLLELPKNIHTSSWIPQVKVLKHPNIKAFITHGGLMGTQEALHYGVPLIGIPLFADQFINIDTVVRHKVAIGLDLYSLTEEKMDNVLNTILRDPTYRETARKFSKKFLDRPLSAIDTAVYWVEYIVRHGGDALRSPSTELTWWQVQLLDVYLFLVAVTLLSIYLLIAAVRYMFSLINVEQNVSHKKKIS